MEGFDFANIAPIVIFAAIVFISQWRARKSAAKRNEQGEAEILEEFDFESFDKDMQQITKPRVERVERPAPKKRVEPIAPKVAEPILSEESGDSSTAEFDLRKAVIMSEILTPKFKDE